MCYNYTWGRAWSWGDVQKFKRPCAVRLCVLAMLFPPPGTPFPPPPSRFHSILWVSRWMFYLRNLPQPSRLGQVPL